MHSESGGPNEACWVVITLAPPSECKRTAHVWRRCALFVKLLWPHVKICGRLAVSVRPTKSRSHFCLLRIRLYYLRIQKGINFCRESVHGICNKLETELSISIRWWYANFWTRCLMLDLTVLTFGNCVLKAGVILSGLWNYTYAFLRL